MKKNIYTIITVMLLSLTVLQGEHLFAEEGNSIWKRVDLSGFLRIRTWYAGSKIKVADKFAATDNYKHIYYQDLFFRNRFSLKVLSNLKIKTVFDISAKFGYGDFAIGSAAAANILTRNVYAAFKPFDEGVLEIGLKPFSLPGGFIIAKDATGLQYSHSLFKKRLRVYGAFINAYDSADSAFSDVSDSPHYADDNVAFAGTKFMITPDITGETYYAFEYDRYFDADDHRKVTLHWAGLHGKVVFGDFLFRAGGIINLGHINVRADETSPFVRSDITAALFEGQIGYTLGNLQINLVAEGATGDPASSTDGSSFQSVKASHGFSYMVVDNSGGLAFRGSNWYGLIGNGLKLQYSLLESVQLDLAYFHFNTMKKVVWNTSESVWYGEEVDFKAAYLYKEVLSVFFTAGVFLPRDAYKNTVQHDAGGVILEMMLGAQASY
ncbi:MAG: hypothetical protein GY754_42920 [bacterium]|nr:hypothetical protein [bacterium]